MASHPLDLQTFPSDADPHVTVTHVGPPAPNVEVKLVGVLDTSVEKGGDPTGDVCISDPYLCTTLKPYDADSCTRTISCIAPSSSCDPRS
jgi:hypothetical protein